MDSSLAGKRLLVVGASSGIGRAVGVAAAASGSDVAFAARRTDLLADAVGAAGTGCAVALDVRDEESVVAGVATAVGSLGGLDGLVYAAGMSPLGTLTDLGAAEWRSVFETNVIGAALVAREVVPHLGPDGLAAFISSISVGRPRRGLVSYSASKAALDELVRGLRSEYRERRFLRVVVGDTAGTDFGATFDGGAMTELLPHWIVEGHLYARQMDAADLGVAIADILAAAFAHPGIALSDVRLEPPGGPLTLPADADALAAFDPPGASGAPP